MKKPALFFALCLLTLTLGCAGFDEMDTLCETEDWNMGAYALDPWTTAQMEDFWTMTTEDATTESLEQALEGEWLGQGNSSTRRIIMNADKTYTIYEAACAGKWRKQRSGRYFVTTEPSNGLIRQVLNLTMPEYDYAVYYHFENGALFLEEPEDGGESAMRFVRTNAA